MNIAGGEAADQMVRMMLSSGELVIRMSGSALKNLAAISFALARNHKKLYGKVRMGKILRETRDVRMFPMTPEQYRVFRKNAGQQKLLYAAIRDADEHGKLVDVVMPAAEVSRANVIFQRMMYHPQREHAEKPEPEQKSDPPKKDSRSGPGLRDTSLNSPICSENAEPKKTNGRTSVIERLKGYRAQLDNQHSRAPAREKSKNHRIR